LKILITGASSLPGFRITEAILRKGHQVMALYLTHDIPLNSKNLIKVQLDIRNYHNLLKITSEFKPNVVIHVASLGDVDACEKDKVLAWSVNVEGTKNIVKMAKQLSSFLIYLSTDYVFDGQRGSYHEDDIPSPINYYGLTKLCSEIAVSILERFAIVRASTIYGFGPGRANFAKILLERLSKGERIKAVSDQYTSPTQASLLGEAITEIAERELIGIFHIVGPKLSRYEFAVKLAKHLGLDSSLIERASMKEMNWVAPRPRDSSLNCDLTRQKLIMDFHSLDRALITLKKELQDEFNISKANASKV